MSVGECVESMLDPLFFTAPSLQQAVRSIGRSELVRQIRDIVSSGHDLAKLDLFSKLLTMRVELEEYGIIQETFNKSIEYLVYQNAVNSSSLELRESCLMFMEFLTSRDLTQVEPLVFLDTCHKCLTDDKFDSIVKYECTIRVIRSFILNTDFILNSQHLLIFKSLNIIFDYNEVIGVKSYLAVIHYVSSAHHLMCHIDIRIFKSIAKYAQTYERFVVHHLPTIYRLAINLQQCAPRILASMQLESNPELLKRCDLTTISDLVLDIPADFDLRCRLFLLTEYPMYSIDHFILDGECSEILFDCVLEKCRFHTYIYDEFLEQTYRELSSTRTESFYSIERFWNSIDTAQLSNAYLLRNAFSLLR